MGLAVVPEIAERALAMRRLDRRPNLCFYENTFHCTQRKNEITSLSISKSITMGWSF
jgi:hypothetical protein